MGYIRMISEEEATGAVAEDYEFIAYSYGNALAGGNPLPVAAMYRASSIVPPWLRFIADQNRLLTEDGKHYLDSDAAVPRLTVCFAVAMYSSCFH